MSVFPTFVGAVPVAGQKRGSGIGFGEKSVQPFSLVEACVNVVPVDTRAFREWVLSNTK